METARRVNKKGCVAPKMGIVSVNGTLVLVPQVGDKLRASRVRIAVNVLGVKLGHCIRF